MNNEIDLVLYEQFVKGVTSDASLDLEVLIERLRDLQKIRNVDIAPLLTGAVGLAGEGGEFNDLVKKILFQGKELDEKTHNHLLKELGDIIFYWSTAVRALGADPNQIIQMNVDKLSSRYPGGFSIAKSQTRAVNDI